MSMSIRLTSGIILSSFLIFVSVETRRLTSFLYFDEQNYYDDVAIPASSLPCSNKKQQYIRNNYNGNKKNNNNIQSITTNNINTIPKPKNLRLIFMGDSVTRYQYLSLAYYLRYGYWYDSSIQINNLVNAHSFHHPLHPNEDWNEFFLQSNRILYPNEICDCLRSRNGEILVERRYFYDKTHNNLLTYINMNGNKTNPGRGYYGRLDSRAIYGPSFDESVGLPLGMDLTDDNTTKLTAIQWEYHTWGDVIRNHVGNLNLQYNNIEDEEGNFDNYINDNDSNDSIDENDNIITNNSIEREEESSSSSSTTSPTYVLLNAGLHRHNFMDPIASQDVINALNELNFIGIWKTTTYTKQQIIEFQSSTDFPAIGPPSTLQSDIHMCQLLSSNNNNNNNKGHNYNNNGCYKLSPWTAFLQPNMYYDDLHFLEPFYRILNEDYLDQLNLLPDGYVKYDKSNILIDDALELIEQQLEREQDDPEESFSITSQDDYNDKDNNYDDGDHDSNDDIDNEEDSNNDNSNDDDNTL